MRCFFSTIYKWHPAALKQKGDWSYTEGVNNVIMHVYIHQPYSDKIPGVNAWFGIEFNRHNTWFSESKAWIDYQRRCMYMLQQGSPVRDLCFYIGDDAPQMNYWVDKNLSNGYSYDLINADVILNRLTVKNGKLTLPEGITYSALVLPPLKTMRPEVLERIEKLVNDGAILIGTAPENSPSLNNYPLCDKKLQQISKNLFPGSNSTTRLVGKGRVFSGLEINGILNQIDVPQDVSGVNSNNIKWIHRTSENGEIYFLSNQGNQPYEGILNFRVSDMMPEMWNAVTGKVITVNSYNKEKNMTAIPIKLNVGESIFVVFRKGENTRYSSSLSFDANYPANNKIMDILSAWNVKFEDPISGETFNKSFNRLTDWKDSEDAQVKYFSGKATYSTSFKFKKKNNNPVYIHFDNINIIGTVYINGKEISTLWVAPYETDISNAIVNGENKIEVKVTNLWVNKLIEQRKKEKEKEKRSTWTLVDVVQVDQQLEPSGITGNCYLFSK